MKQIHNLISISLKLFLSSQNNTGTRVVNSRMIIDSPSDILDFLVNKTTKYMFVHAYNEAFYYSKLYPNYFIIQNMISKHFLTKLSSPTVNIMKKKQMDQKGAPGIIARPSG